MVLLSLLFTSSWAIAQVQEPKQTTSGAPSSNSNTAAQDTQHDSPKQDLKTDPPAQPTPATTGADPVKTGGPIQPTPQSSGQGKVEGTSNDRLFYTLPNFLTLENAKQLPPMPVKDKFKAVAVGNFDVVEFPWWGVISAIGQASNSDPAFGQGWKSYAERYAVTMGDSTVENFMVGAVFPSVFRQDPRFYQSGKGSFWHRTGHALGRMVITYSDSGHTQFNFSEIVGAATAGAISTYTYHPRSTYISTPSNPHMFIASERTLSNAASTWGTQLYLDALTLEIKEFWPDIHRILSKHKKPEASLPPAL